MYIIYTSNRKSYFVPILKVLVMLTLQPFKGKRSWFIYLMSLLDPESDSESL